MTASKKLNLQRLQVLLLAIGFGCAVLTTVHRNEAQRLAAYTNEIRSHFAEARQSEGPSSVATPTPSLVTGSDTPTDKAKFLAALDRSSKASSVPLQSVVFATTPETNSTLARTNLTITARAHYPAIKQLVAGFSHKHPSVLTQQLTIKRAGQPTSPPSPVMPLAVNEVEAKWSVVLPMPSSTGALE